MTPEESHGITPGALAADFRGTVCLHTFLACCRSDWGARELRAVEEKLGLVGVQDVKQLRVSLASGSLNDILHQAGEKAFTTQTLDAMRKTLSQIGLSLPVKTTTPHRPALHTRCSHNLDADLDGFAPVGAGEEYTCGGSSSSSARTPPCHGQAHQAHAERVGGARCDDFGVQVESQDTPDRSPEGEDSPTADFVDHFPAMGRKDWQGAKCGRRGWRYAHIDERAGLKEHVCKGLLRVERAAAEAKRRNRDVTRCLAEVQADMARIRNRMKAVRMQRGERSQSVAEDAQSDSDARWLHERRHKPGGNGRGTPAPAGGLGGAEVPPRQQAPPVAHVPQQAPQPPPSPRPPRPRSNASMYPQPDEWIPSHPGGEAGTEPSSSHHHPQHLRRPGVFCAVGRADSLGGVRPPPARPPVTKTQSAPGQRCAKPYPCSRAAESGFRFGSGAPPKAETPISEPSRPGRPASSEPPQFRGPTPTSRAASDRARSSAKPQRLDPISSAQESVKAQLSQARSSSKDDQRALIKKLLVTWHPDRNLDSVKVATAVFQYIQQEKDSLLNT